MPRKDYRTLRRRPLFVPLVLPILTAFAVVLLLAWAWNASNSTTVIIVRHAETMPEPAEDPPLSPMGAYRAEALAGWLRDAGIQHIFVSEYLRTRQTAEPLAKATGAQVHEVPARDTKGLVRSLRGTYRGQVVLVIGHGNTVLDLIRALGGEAPDVEEAGYSSMFIVTDSRLTKTRVLSMRYGG